MCGIAGFFDLQGKRQPDAEVLTRMTRALAHRGPDDEGMETGPGWGLGHRRLAIIGLADGHQPLGNEDGSVRVVFNGEIYNHRELRRQLAGRGHCLRSSSDTEVLVHLFEDKGADLAGELTGMFAFAIVEPDADRLLLVRDRLGQKPLFYTCSEDGWLIFASEFHALVEHPAVSREIDPQAVFDYLSLSCVPAPRSIYRNVRKLPPGCLLDVRRGGELSPRQFWQPGFAPKLDLDFDEAVVQTREHIERAVADRLESEVPLGAFLSGGLDSAVVVAIMQQQLQQPVKTFTIGFSEARYDERGLAQCLADFVGAEHREQLANPSDVDLLHQVVRQYSEPFCDSSALPTTLLSRFTREHVTVALSGDGGDELFGGYRRYQFMALHQRLQAIPASLRRMLVKTTEKLLPSARSGRTMLANLNRALEASGRSPVAAFAGFQEIFSEEAKRELMAGSEAACTHHLPAWEEIVAGGSAEDFVERFMELDTRVYLPEDLLVKVDIASMAYALEVRSPFLDHRLREFVDRLPRGFKVSLRRRKRLLQAVADGLVPEEIRCRGKRGFGVPLSEWLRGGLKGEVARLLDEHSEWDRNKLFKTPVIARYVREHLSGKRDHAFRLWALLCFRIWCDEVHCPR